MAGKKVGMVVIHDDEQRQREEQSQLPSHHRYSAAADGHHQSHCQGKTTTSQEAQHQQQQHPRRTRPGPGCEFARYAPFLWLDDWGQNALPAWYGRALLAFVTSVSTAPSDAEEDEEDASELDVALFLSLVSALHEPQHLRSMQLEKVPPPFPPTRYYVVGQKKPKDVSYCTVVGHKLGLGSCCPSPARSTPSLKDEALVRFCACPAPTLHRHDVLSHVGEQLISVAEVAGAVGSVPLLVEMLQDPARFCAGDEVASLCTVVFLHRLYRSAVAQLCVFGHLDELRALAAYAVTKNLLRDTSVGVAGSVGVDLTQDDFQRLLEYACYSEQRRFRWLWKCVEYTTNKGTALPASSPSVCSAELPTSSSGTTGGAARRCSSAGRPFSLSIIGPVNLLNQGKANIYELAALRGNTEVLCLLASVPLDGDGWPIRLPFTCSGIAQPWCSRGCSNAWPVEAPLLERHAGAGSRTCSTGSWCPIQGDCIAFFEQTHRIVETILEEIESKKSTCTGTSAGRPSKGGCCDEEGRDSSEDDRYLEHGVKALLSPSSLQLAEAAKTYYRRLETTVSDTIEAKLHSALVCAVEQGQLDCLRALLRLCPVLLQNIHAIVKRNNLLHVAAQQKHSACLQQLLALGNEPNLPLRVQPASWAWRDLPPEYHLDCVPLQELFIGLHRPWDDVRDKGCWMQYECPLMVQRDIRYRARNGTTAADAVGTMISQAQLRCDQIAESLFSSLQQQEARRKGSRRTLKEREWKETYRQPCSCGVQVTEQREKSFLEEIVLGDATLIADAEFQFIATLKVLLSPAVGLEVEMGSTSSSSITVGRLPSVLFQRTKHSLGKEISRTSTLRWSQGWSILDCLASGNIPSLGALRLRYQYLPRCLLELHQQFVFNVLDVILTYYRQQLQNDGQEAKESSVAEWFHVIDSFKVQWLHRRPGRQQEETADDDEEEEGDVVDDDDVDDDDDEEGTTSATSAANPASQQFAAVGTGTSDQPPSGDDDNVVQWLQWLMAVVTTPLEEHRGTDTRSNSAIELPPLPTPNCLPAGAGVAHYS